MNILFIWGMWFSVVIIMLVMVWKLCLFLFGSLFMCSSLCRLLVDSVLLIS